MLNRRGTLLLITVAVGGFSGSCFAQNPPNWSYGAFNGPTYWAQMIPTSCAATTLQSPIAIPANLETSALPHIQFNYNTATFLVENINYAIEIVAPTAPGSPTNNITLNGDTYNLVQIHFHFPNEHSIAGVTHPVMEIHFVHQDANQKILVIAVSANLGGSNTGVGLIWNNLPPSYGDHGSVSLNPSTMLPGANKFDELGYYTYQGSLTAPPCSPGVTWVVLKRQIDISADQLAKAKCNSYPNARPILTQTATAVIQETDY